MTGLPALDVALGLSFVYFLLSTMATAVTEIISRAFNWRARTLEKWLDKTLATGGTRPPWTPSTHRRSSACCASPAARRTARRRRLHAVAALRGRGARRGSRRPGEGERGRHRVDGVRTRLTTGPLRDTEVGQSLIAILDHVGGSATDFRREAETWFDDQMERLSGVYKRWTQVITLVIGALVVVLVQADSIRMAVTLWRDPAARDIVAAQASSASGSMDANAALDEVDKLPLPLRLGRRVHVRQRRDRGDGHHRRAHHGRRGVPGRPVLVRRADPHRPHPQHRGAAAGDRGGAARRRRADAGRGRRAAGHAAPLTSSTCVASAVATLLRVRSERRQPTPLQ